MLRRSGFTTSLSPPAEEALTASESRCRRRVELSSYWYWVQEDNLRFRQLSGVEKRGIDPEAFIGKARWELQGSASLPEKAWQQHREKLERHEPFSDFVYTVPDNAGEMRYLSVTGEPIFDAQGKFKGYHGIGKDITDKARALKDLEDGEQRYRMLFDIHPRPMWVVENKTLRFLAVNQAAVDHYGYSREEFLSMTAEQLRPPEDIAQLLKDFEDPSRSYMQRVARHRKKNGEQIKVEIVSFNLAFDGRPARLAVIDDVTERLKPGGSCLLSLGRLRTRGWRVAQTSSGEYGIQCVSNPRASQHGTRMKFSFFHLMPYTHLEMETHDWPLPNR
jgi:PAS domain S-box-containing protein